MGTTAEKLTVTQARKALELFDSEYIGQDGQQLWEWAVGEVIKPPEPEYRHGDPVYVDGGEYGIYMRPTQENRHLVSVESQTLVRDMEEIRPAPYRIRLRPDDRAPKDEPLKAVFIGLSPERYLLKYVGKSAQVIIE